MPIIVECDGGCGKTAASLDEFKRFGYVVPGRYCEDCAGSIQAFLEERDKLHDKAAKVWQTGLAKLEATWRGEHKGGTLPQ